MSKEVNEEQEERAGRIVDGRIPFYTGVKPSIQAALDEGLPHHHPSVRSSLERPEDVFDPADPEMQGLPLAGDPRTPEEKVRLSVTVDDRVAKALDLHEQHQLREMHRDALAGFKVEPGSAPTTAPEPSLLDAMRYGTGFTRISSGNEGVEVTNVPYQDMLASYMDFGHAIRCMEAGNRVQREGWNGKGMWIAIQIPDANSKMGLPYIYMSTVTGQLVPWLASQSDMLAKDWRIVP
jgi:hypothetical protein